jgi:hypothetical protein
MDKDLYAFIITLLLSSCFITLVLIAIFARREHKYNHSMIKDDQDLFDALQAIAQNNVPGLVTLTEAGADRLDFHEVHVRTLHDMLKKAFDLGFKHRDHGGFN